MRVFLAGTSLAASYGGPAISVARLAMALVDEGVEVGLWAPDGTATTTPALPSASEVRRISGSAVDALDAFGRADVIHDNGLWRPHNHRLATLAGARGIPRVVSTRGMLEPWARQHKRFKKEIAWRLFQRRDLTRARCLVASSAAEARHVGALGLGVPIRTVPNGVDLPLQRQQTGIALPRSGDGVRTALFVGRIYPVKGLPMLVEAWARVRPEGWRLRIAGPDEAGHRLHVERAVSALGLSEVISFTGPVAGDAKLAALFGAELFVLPTRSESFGMAVAESLAHGVPVLTTTAAPWADLVARDCGWSVAPTVDGIAAALRAATSCEPETLREMGARGRAWMETEFTWGGVAKLLVEVYRSVL